MSDGCRGGLTAVPVEIGVRSAELVIAGEPSGVDALVDDPLDGLLAHVGLGGHLPVAEFDPVPVQRWVITSNTASADGQSACRTVMRVV